MTPQELVEHALAASRSDDCVVIARSSTGANLRWANNTLTTNGVMRGSTVTVIAFARRSDGIATASVSGTASTAEQVERLVEAADAAAAAGTPAPDAAELVSGSVDPDWAEPPAETGIEVYSEFAPALGESFGRARASGRILYGFVDHELTTTYLGSTTGMRRRDRGGESSSPVPRSIASLYTAIVRRRRSESTPHSAIAAARSESESAVAVGAP